MEGMQILKSGIRDKIIKNSISLEKYGVNEFAWSKKDAKKLICEIMHENVGILGGDVYILTNHSLEALGENWACEPTRSESKEEYFQRSKSKSLNYIDCFPVSENEKIFFRLFLQKKSSNSMLFFHIFSLILQMEKEKAAFLI